MTRNGMNWHTRTNLWPLIIILGACAPTFETVDSIGQESFAASWEGRLFSDAVQAWGEPDSRAEGETFFWWHEGASETRCIRRLTVDDDGLITNAEVTPNCPPLRKMETFGWVPPLDTTDIQIGYERFHQTYRVATTPETIFLDEGAVVLQASVVAGFHKDDPGNSTYALILRAPSADGGGVPAGVLDIPVSAGISAEARVLVDEEDAFSVPAIEELPIRGLVTGGDYLAIVLTPLRDRLKTAGSLEVLLPSGQPVALSAQHLDAVSRMIFLLLDPRRIDELLPLNP